MHFFFFKLLNSLQVLWSFMQFCTMFFLQNICSITYICRLLKVRIRLLKVKKKSRRKFFAVVQLHKAALFFLVGGLSMNLWCRLPWSIMEEQFLMETIMFCIGLTLNRKLLLSYQPKVRMKFSAFSHFL